MWTFLAGVGVEVEVFLFPVLAAMCRLPSGKSGQMRPEHLVATDIPAPLSFQNEKTRKRNKFIIVIVADINLKLGKDP